MTVSHSFDDAWRSGPLLGREALLRLLETRLRSDHRLVIGVDPSLQSSIGHGRSRIAEELIQRTAPNKHRVYRLNAEGEESWISSLQLLALTLDVRQKVFRRRSELCMAVRDRLQCAEEWTLLIDSIDSRVVDLDFLKDLRTGQIILIVNSHEDAISGDWPTPVPVGRLRTEDALQILQHALGSSSNVAQQSQQLLPLIQLVDRNPLCLELVGRLITTCHLDVFDICRELEGDNSHDPLHRCLRAIIRRLSPETRSVLATCVAWGAGQFAQTTPGQNRLFTLGSGSAIDELRRIGLLRSEEPSGELQLVARDAVQSCLANRDLSEGIARAHSLLPASPGRGGPDDITQGFDDSLVDDFSNQRIGMGRLLLSQSELDARQCTWLREAADAAMGHLIPELATLFLKKLLSALTGQTNQATQCVDLLTSLGLAYSQAEQYQLARKAWRQATDYCSHDEPRHLQLQLAIAEIDVNENRMDRAAGRLLQATEKIETAPPSKQTDLWKGQCLFLKGGLALSRGNIDKAAHRFREALNLRSSILPDDHPLLMRNRLMLARAEFLQENLNASEALLKDEIAIRESSKSVADSDLAIACQFLAEQYYLSGRLSDAEPVYQRVFDLRLATLPQGHRLIGETANRLAVIKSARGAYRESDGLFRKSLSILEQNYGTEHPEVARLLNDLAESLISQNKIDSARRLLERALGIQERSLRASDARLGRTRCNLATVYVARGRFVEAIRLYEADLTQRKPGRVNDKAALATTLNNLAEALRSVGRFQEAEQNFQQSLHLREELVGRDHPLVAQVLSNLGYLNLQLHRYEPAQDYLQRSLSIREAKLSGDHPYLASTLATLADAFFLQGRHEEARPFYARAIQIALTAYGDRHPQVATFQICSARNELRLGHLGRAELMFLRNKITIEEVLGSDHRMAAKALLGMAELAHAEKRYETAFPWIERCLTIQRGTMASQRLEIAETLSTITDNLTARGLWSDALPRVLESVELQRNVLPEGHPEILPNLARIGRIQKELKQPAEAEEAFRFVLEHASPTDNRTLLAEVREHLTDVLIAQQKYDDAAALLRTRIEYCELDQDSPVLLDMLGQLSGVYYLCERPVDALPIIERCVAMSERMYGSDSVERARHLDNLAGVRFLIGQHTKAEDAVLESLAILERHQPQEQVSLDKARGNYIQLLRETNRSDKADELSSRWTPSMRETADVPQLPTSSSSSVSAVGLPSSHVLDDL